MGIPLFVVQVALLGPLGGMDNVGVSAVCICSGTACRARPILMDMSMGNQGLAPTVVNNNLFNHPNGMPVISWQTIKAITTPNVTPPTASVGE